MLVTGSVLAGLTESGILAVLAQSAAALVSQTSQVHIELGPLQLNETLGVLLTFAMALALARLALQFVISTVPTKMAADMQAQMRTELFEAFTQASWSEKARDREGHLQELMTNQAASATGAALQSTNMLTAGLAFVVLVASALVLNVFAALLVLVAAAGLFAALRPLGALGRRWAGVLSQTYLGHAGGVNEAVRLAEESHVFGVAAAQREQINRLVSAVRKPFFHTALLERLVPGVYQCLIYLLIVAALMGLSATGTTHVASLGAVVLLLVRAGSYGQRAQGAYQAVRQTLPYLDRVQAAQHRYAASSPPQGKRPLERIESLSFERVCFAYEPSRPVLSDIRFEVRGGETIGIVGPSGAGKSTLVQILLRLRPPERGRYLVNGLPAEEFASADWHRLVTYVPQEPRLLHASVADNIRFLRDIDDDAVERAARLAGIHDDIVAWPAGYDTIVGPRADAVSGGQQQRICLARALAAEPEVLVLDEPTSALDPHSEHLIQESLSGLKHELTLFIVAHRMSTLDICERVMVIVDGRLEAFDAADRLRRDNLYYRSASALAAGPSLAADASLEE